MNIGQRVVTHNGALGIIVGLLGKKARICLFTPNGRLTYIAETHLIARLTRA